MTKENYQNIKKLRDTPASGNVCLPAALDIISEHESMPVSIYEKYNEEYLRLNQTPNRHDIKSLYRDVLLGLGGVGLRNFRVHAIDSKNGLAKVLDNARQGGRRPLIYVTPRHVVGVKPEEDETWTLHGTWGPYPTNTGEAITYEEMFPLVTAPHITIDNKSYKMANVFVFPSENKKR